MIMIKQWQDLQTVQDALLYCKERAARYRTDMKSKDKEQVASAISAFSFSDYFDEWAKEYPIVDDIEMLASDLEWSNSSDVDEDWEKLQASILQLEREVNQKAGHGK